MGELIAQVIPPESPKAPEQGTFGAATPLIDNVEVSAPDLTAPAVTVEQATGQADPTDSSPVHFTAVFSEPIDVSSFTTSDVTLGGSAGGALAAAITQIAPNDGTRFDLAVSGMTISGTVTAAIGADQVTDVALNGNTASTSADHTVSYVYYGVITAIPALGFPGLALLSLLIAGLGLALLARRP